jgi:hypothetical protein
MLFDRFSRPGQSKRMVKRAALAAALALAGGSMARAASQPTEVDNQFFDWMINDQAGYLSSPFLSDASAHAVNAFLSQQPASSIKAVKVQGPISNSTASLIFNNPKYNISYVLGDLEGGSTVSNVSTLVKQVQFVNASNGKKTVSTNAFIGNFGFQTYASPDVTDPNNYNAQRGTHSFSGWTNADFHAGGLTMHMPELYAGSPSFRNPAAGNSNAPNIRSALFTMPVLRLSEVSVSRKKGEALVPYIARFNNFNNLALDTDRDPSDGYRFVPGEAIPAKFGLPGLSASQTQNQMLSRKDVAAEVAHLRLRGADSFVAFEPGVEGYDNTQKRTDMQKGWTEPHINALFAAKDFKLVIGTESDYPSPPKTNDTDPNGNIFIDGQNKSIEAAGALFSGIYSNSLKTLDILMSNMGDGSHELELPPSIGGHTLEDNTFTLGGGNHLLVEYKLANGKWKVNSTISPFAGMDNGRNGVGIPEPTTAALAAGIGLFGAIRRRRRDLMPV